MRTSVRKDILNLYILFFISVFVIYKLPTIVGSIFQILLLIIFWYSKKDYFWLAFVYIVESNPGGLFFMGDPQNSFSLIQNSPMGNLYFWIVFTVLAFIKHQRTKANSKFIFRSNFTILFAYLVLLFFSFGIYKIPAVFRLLLPWLYIFLLPRMLKDIEDYARFFYLIIAFVPVVFFMQVYSIFFGGTVGTAFGGRSNEYIQYLSIEETSQALRPADGIFIPFFSILGSLIFLVHDKKMFSRNYLLFNLIISIISIFITATRSWMIATLLIWLGYILIVSKNPIKSMIQYVLLMSSFILILWQIPSLRKQAELSFERYETVELLTKGDITAGGTLQRFDVRAPRVMKHFYESPIIGWGFGNEGSEYADGHVGHQNLLMQTGVIGYLLFFSLWINYILKMWKVYKNMSQSNPQKKLPLILIIFFLGIHVINISAQWFNYLITFNVGVIVCMLLVFGSYLYRESVNKNCKVYYFSNLSYNLKTSYH